MGKRLLKRLSILVLVGLTLNLVISNASAIYGEAVIDPIESNLAVKFWVRATSDVQGSDAALAHDDDLDSAWMTGDSKAGHWLMLDLGGVYDNLHKAEVIFLDRKAAYQYILEASSDGKNWTLIADRKTNTILGEGFIDLFTRSATRYVRLTITGASPGAAIGIKELRIFNYLRSNIVNGADMSYMDQYQNLSYYLNPNPQKIDMGPGPHVLDVVKDRGMRFIRLRIWNEPRIENTGVPSNPPYNNPARSAEVARWIKTRGLLLGIDFHYADSWADPGKQPKPKAWAALPFDDLVKAMHDFTYDYVRLLVEQGTPPDKVAVGNEIINGFLWGSESAEMEVSNPRYVINNTALYWSQPGGGLLWRYWNSSDAQDQQKYEQAWEQFSTLVAAGIRAVREASPQTAVEIHIICDRNKLDKTMEFWKQLLTRLKTKDAEPDVLALSYYPEWHGTHTDLERALYAMASTYPEYKINISETAYPATGESNPLGYADQPRTVQGQANMLKRTIQVANDIINNQGTGVLVWEPQIFQPMFKGVAGMDKTYEPNASMDVFNKAFATTIIEQTIYRTTTENIAPVLPDSVQMLKVSDGSIKAVPVNWKAILPDQIRSSGTFTTTGMTGFGEVTARITVIYPFSGFLTPVLNPPAINLKYAGRTIPIKFRVNGNHGLALIRDGYPSSQQVDCDTGEALGFVEPATAGGQGLIYNPYMDKYTYNWKTLKTWANTCRRFILLLEDGTEYDAMFRFR